ncbi:MAG: hypothetical protein R3E53_12085 [Myxococcota bacterium]
MIAVAALVSTASAINANLYAVTNVTYSSRPRASSRRLRPADRA